MSEQEGIVNRQTPLLETIPALLFASGIWFERPANGATVLSAGSVAEKVHRRTGKTLS
jgi:hypothetical protein